MPRKQDFSQSTIYHICNTETKDIVYVGSSCNFTQRQRNHKSYCCNKNQKNYNQPIYIHIRENGGFDCFEVIPVSFHCFNNKVQLHIQEQNEIDKYPYAMNKNKAYTTKEETEERRKKYYDEHKKELAEKQMNRYLENKDEINEKRRQVIVCECGMETRTGHKARHEKTKSHQLWKEKGIVYTKPEQTYEQSKYDKYKCACGGCYIISHKTTHEKTKRHQEYLLNKIE